MPSYAYWRLTIYNGGGNPFGGPGNAVSLAEWKFFDGSSSQIPTIGGTASASTAGFGAAANAFDGNPNTFWAANVGTSPALPQWLQYQFTSPVDPASFSLSTRNDTSYVQGPEAFKLEASDDGLTWVFMGNYSVSVPWTAAGQTQTLNISATNGTGPVWRILVTSTAATTAAASEITFYDIDNNQIATIPNGQALAVDCFPQNIAGDPTQGPESAFDGNVATWWASISNPNTTSVWIQFRWNPGELPPVYRVCITSRDDPSYSETPLTIDLQYSLDGAAFHTVSSQTFVPWTSAGQTQCFAVSEPVVTCDSPPGGVPSVPYSHTFPASGGTAPYTFSIISGSLPGGLSLDSSTGQVTGTPTTPGVYPFTIQVSDANLLSGSVACSITIGSGLSISCNSPAAGSVGVPYTHTFTASSGTPPYTFAIISGSLPTGVSLDSSTGIASGTPTVPGTFPFRIQVTDSLANTAFTDCSIAIVSTLSIDCASPPNGMVGIPYTHTFPASGGTPPYSSAIISGSLPPGIALDSLSGIASGTPTVAGTSPFRIQVTDSVMATAFVDCSITIDPEPLHALCNSPVPGIVGTPYLHTLGVTGGTPPYTFSVLSGSLPPGLSLDSSTGVISGIPTTEGDYPFTIQVTDGLSDTATCSITILVNPILSTGCPASPAHVESAYSSSLPVSGGTPPYTFLIIAGSLPSGLVLDSTTGAIAGSPVDQGSFPFTWQVIDTAGNSKVTTCFLVVGCPSGYDEAKFQLWAIKYITEPADKAAVTHSYDWDDGGYPYDKKLKSITFEYDGSAGDVIFQMETLLGINGVTNGTPLLFPLIGSSRSKQQFGIQDGNVVKMVRVSPTTAPDIDFKSWRYVLDFEKYPPDFVFWTEKSYFGWPCEKIARNLHVEIDTAGVPATVEVFADGNLKQTLTITTTSNDRSRVIAMLPNLIGREWYLHLTPGVGGKTQLFNWHLEYVKEPCAVSFYSSYEQDLGVLGVFKYIKQVWIEYQSQSPIVISVFVDGGKQLLRKDLPAHPTARDVERFYVAADSGAVDDQGNTVLNKSKKYRIDISTDDGSTFKIYADSFFEYGTFGDGQRLRRFILSENNQLPVQ